MNSETRAALMCGAKLREVLTDIVEAVQGVPTDGAVGVENPAAATAVIKIRELLRNESLYERVFPLEPFDNEGTRDACRRIFGVWIANEACDKEGVR